MEFESKHKHFFFQRNVVENFVYKIPPILSGLHRQHTYLSYLSVYCNYVYSEGLVKKVTQGGVESGACEICQMLKNLELIIIIIVSLTVVLTVVAIIFIDNNDNDMEMIWRKK